MSGDPTADPHLRLAPDCVRYGDLPVPRTPEDYRKTLDLYLDGLRGLPGILGSASFGTLGAPGLSDLDLVVVTAPEIEPETARTLSPTRLPGPARDLFVHPPYVVHAGTVRHLLEHLDWPALHPVLGEIPACSGGEPGGEKEDREPHRIGLLMEKLAAHLALFSRAAHSRAVEVRASWPLLYSVRYSLEIAAELLGERPEPWASWTAGVQRLRADWFDLPDDAARVAGFARCMAEAWSAAADACFRLERRLRADGRLPCLAGDAGRGVFATDTWEALVPVPVSAPGSLLEADSRLNAPPPAGWRLAPFPGARRLARFHWLPVPEFHRALLAAATAHAGAPGRRLAAARVTGPASTGFQPASDLEACLAERARRLKEQAEFQRRNGLPFGTACTGLTLLPDSYVPPHRRGVRRRLLWRVNLAYSLPRLAGRG